MNAARITIVEDEILISTDIRKQLEKMGHTVVGEFRKGEEAIQSVRSEKPDLVLMDIVLAGEIDGIEAAGRIRSETGIPVMFLTAYADVERLKQAGTVLPFGFIIKPFKSRDLKVTIEMALHAAEAARQEAEEKSAQTQKLVQNIIDHSVSNISVKDKEGRYILVNDSFLKQFGLAAEEIVGKTDHELLDKETADEFRTEDLIVLNNKTTINREVNFEWHGETRTYMITKFPLMDENDEPTRTCAQSTDITERVKAEEALRESEKKYRSVVEASILGITIHQDGRYVYANSAYCDLVGYTFEELEEMPPAVVPSVVHPDDVILIKKRVKDRMAGKPLSPKQEHRVIHKNGEVKWIEGYSSMVEFNGIRSLQTITNDITERKMAEDALRETDQRVNGILSSLHDTIIILFDRDGKHLSVWGSPNLDQKYGVRAKDIEGLYLKDVLPPDQLDERMAELTHIFETGQPIRNEVLMPFPNGSFWHDIAMSPVFGDDGKVIYVVGFIQDISDRKNLETQLRQAQKLEAIGTLAGGIAHDFNNILAAILGFSELAIMDLPEGHPSIGSLEEVLIAGHRARNLVKQILSFSRPGDLEMKPTRIDSIVKEALVLARASLPTTIDIRENIAKPQYTISDPTQIHQVLMNLFSNAGYAMKDSGGVLEVSTTTVEIDEQDTSATPALTPGSYHKLTISDTGFGMDQETLSRIFEPFFSTKGPTEGTGMGLAVVHGIINGHHGSITAQSQPGKGTSFDILLPAIDREPESYIDSGEAKLPKGSEKVLFVDDEKALVAMAGNMLSRLGYSPTTVNSSTEALKLFESQNRDFDLVITDMTMPDMTGLDLAKKMLEIRPDIPIILCTGYSQLVTSESLAAVGIKALMAKPITVNSMAETIRLVLDEDEETPSRLVLDEDEGKTSN